MPSTYTSNNKIQKIATGEQSGTWGNTTNTNFDLFDTAIDGFVSITLSSTTHTLNIPDGSAGDGRNKVLVFTGTLAATNTISVTPNTVKKHYYVQNNTTGGQNIVLSQGSGSSVTVKPGYSSIVYLDGAGSGAAVKEVLTSLKLTALLEATGAVLNGSSSGSTTLQASATASGTLTLPAATDTLVGKATTDTFTNKTFDTAGTGNVLRINGTQVSAVTGTGSVVLATSPTLVTPLLGTPTSGTLTNCTGLPVSTGISGLGSGVATFLATPSSANLAAAVTDETGTGALVFGTSPTIATPTITTSATVPLVIGGTGTTSTLTLRSTSGVGTTGADIIFQTGNNGATEVMRLQNGGNVGIGTASPDALLTVSGVGAFGDGSVSAPSVANTGDLNTGLWFPAADTIAASTGGSERLRIDSSGNVTIGSTGDNSTRRLGFTTASGGTSAIESVTVGATDQALVFKTTFSTESERMRIDGQGNVGIGTSSPVAKTDIYYTSTAPSLSSQSGAALSLLGSSTLRIAFGSDPSSPFGGWIQSSDAAGTSFPLNLNPLGGNVGIGTSSPSSLLTVRKSGTGDTLRLACSNGGPGDGPALMFFDADTENAAQISTSKSAANTASLLFATANGGSPAERMRIESSGNVLIGYTTSNGSYLLQVNSQIFATNATIATSDGRYKENISPIKSGLDVVGKLNPVSFTWKQHEIHNFDSCTQVGFIAQDVQAALIDEPYLESVVKRNEVELKDGAKEEFYGLSDAKLIPILVKAIQELKAEIDILKSRN